MTHWSVDPNVTPPDPWTEWDDYGGCWVCEWCGTGAGYGLHPERCKYHPDNKKAEDTK